MRKQLIGLLLAVMPCGGCSSYTASQAALAQQARKGVAIWASDADWVIEARRGYAAGLNALAQAQSAALAANEAARRDAAATDAALEKLEWLLSIQSGFESLFNQKGDAR